MMTSTVLIATELLFIILIMIIMPCELVVSKCVTERGVSFATVPESEESLGHFKSRLRSIESDIAFIQFAKVGEDRLYIYAQDY